MCLQLPFIKKSHRRHSFPIITSDNPRHVSAINETQCPRPELQGLRCNPEPSPCWQECDYPHFAEDTRRKSKKAWFERRSCNGNKAFSTQNSLRWDRICTSANWVGMVLFWPLSLYIHALVCTRGGVAGGVGGGCIYFLALFIIYLMQTELWCKPQVALVKAKLQGHGENCRA